MSNCKLCGKEPSRYTCPRCNVQYCSLQCYAGPLHSNCSEGFYREQVQQQLHNHRAPPDSREKMKQMLKRLEEEDMAAAAAFPSFDLHGGEPEQEEEEELDSDDDDDLETRLKGVDLDDSDKVWQCLTEDERRQFRELVQTGDVAAVLPPYMPWWQPPEGDTEGGAAIVELQDAEAQSFKGCQNKPKILTENSSINSKKELSNSTEQGKRETNCKDVQTSENLTESKISLENTGLDNLNLSDSDTIAPSTSNSFTNEHFSSKTSESNNNSSPTRNPSLKSNSYSDSSITTENSNAAQTKSSSCAKPNRIGGLGCPSTHSLSPSEKISTGTLQPSRTRLGANGKSELKNRRNELMDAFPCVPAALKAKYPNCPPLPRVKLLSNLISVPPSPCLRYSLVNVTVSYAWLMRLYHGDLTDRSIEAAEGLLSLCGSLSTGQVYSSCDEAAASVTMRALQHDWLSPSEEIAAAAEQDARALLTKPKELPGYFLLAALSHLKDLTRAAAKGGVEPNKGTFISSMVGAESTVDVTLATPAALRAAAHKLDFFMAYAAAHKTDLLSLFAA